MTCSKTTPNVMFLAAKW